MDRFDETRWGKLRLLAAMLVPGCLAGAALAQDRISPVGQWSGESITDDRGIQRWTVTRRSDGSYTVDRFTVRQEGTPTEKVVTRTEQEAGTWTWQDGLLTYTPQGDPVRPRQSWRIRAAGDACLQLVAVAPESGQPLSPAWRFGECRTPGPRPLPDNIVHRCELTAPAYKPGVLSLRIAREADGRYYAFGNGEREETPVEVRDYPVLPDFKPRSPDTLTNAGEALLTLVAGAGQRDAALRRAFGFDVSDVRSTRLWVMQPPRPQRPMDYFTAGRFVLLQAFGADGRLLGGALYSPFVVACPAAAEP